MLAKIGVGRFGGSVTKDENGRLSKIVIRVGPGNKSIYLDREINFNRISEEQIGDLKYYFKLMYENGIEIEDAKTILRNNTKQSGHYLHDTAMITIKHILSQNGINVIDDKALKSMYDKVSSLNRNNTIFFEYEHKDLQDRWDMGRIIHKGVTMATRGNKDSDIGQQSDYTRQSKAMEYVEQNITTPKQMYLFQIFKAIVGEPNMNNQEAIAQRYRQFQEHGLNAEFLKNYKFKNIKSFGREIRMLDWYKMQCLKALGMKNSKQARNDIEKEINKIINNPNLTKNNQQIQTLQEQKEQQGLSQN